MKKSVLLILIPFFVITFASYILSQKACDYALKANPQKKMPFKHSTHLEMYGAKCNQCHSYYDNGQFKGIPEVGACLTPECHDRESKPIFKKFKNEDKPWGAYVKQPDLVYFSHKVVMTAKFEDGRQKMTCSNCHGNMSKPAVAEKLQGKMLMSKCESCHSTLMISNKCAVCHD